MPPREFGPRLRVSCEPVIAIIQRTGAIPTPTTGHRTPILHRLETIGEVLREVVNPRDFHSIHGPDHAVEFRPDVTLMKMWSSLIP